MPAKPPEDHSPSAFEAETIFVLIHHVPNSPDYTLNFLTPNFGHVPLHLDDNDDHSDVVTLAIAESSEATFSILHKPSDVMVEPIDSHQPNFFDGGSYSSGTATFKVTNRNIKGTNRNTTDRTFTINLENEPQRDLEVFIFPKVEESSQSGDHKEVYAFFWAKDPTLGIYHNSHSIFMPPGSRLRFTLHSEVAKEYKFREIRWRTGGEGKPPLWLSVFPLDNAGLDDHFTVETTLLAGALTRWVGFEMFFEKKKSDGLLKAVFAADPTIVHRGSTGPGDGTGGC